MLILSRKKEESLIIEGNIEIKILEIVNGSVKIGIIAPKEIQVHRKEVFEKIKSENQESAGAIKSVRSLVNYKSVK